MKRIYFRSSTLYLSSIAFFILTIVCFTSCEKDVNIKLDSGDSKIVVQGAIETGLPPYVFLTNSVGYFQEINLNTLEGSFVHGAVVKVSDGIQTIQLKEYSIDTGGKGNKFYFYSLDTAVLPYMIGQQEKFYTLTVTYNGQSYNATTKIPTPTPLDSVLSVYPEAPFDKTKYPNARQIRISFKDPDTSGNYVRYFTQRNSEPFFAGLSSVYSDEIINGTKFSTTFPLGEPRSSKRNDTLGTANAGDTVTFKWSAIDKASYDFWSSYEYSLGTVGNPFSTPIKVKGNISNGGLGIWAGYGNLTYKIIME